MTIQCTDIHNFLDVIQGLIERGLTFKANAASLSVTLTGGY